MIEYSPDDWFKALLAALPEEKVSQAVSDDNALWINIEDNVSRLGSLTHGQINIKEIRRQALTLLETESKDFRVVVHLLRTLQHGGNAEELLLARSCWCSTYSITGNRHGRKTRRTKFVLRSR
ncbi:type VI secretion-associated protein, family [Salmonella enterica subsp. arizonae]|nr:type VI secretion-associated protein, family [Salmonella enterica subsp. arizonae]